MQTSSAAHPRPWEPLLLPSAANSCQSGAGVKPMMLRTSVTSPPWLHSSLSCTLLRAVQLLATVTGLSQPRLQGQHRSKERQPGAEKHMSRACEARTDRSGGQPNHQRQRQSLKEGAAGILADSASQPSELRSRDQHRSTRRGAPAAEGPLGWAGWGQAAAASGSGRMQRKAHTAGCCRLGQCWSPGISASVTPAAGSELGS